MHQITNIEQPVETTQGTLFFLRGYGHFGAEYGIHLSFQEYEDRLIKELGKCKLIDKNNQFWFETE